MCEGSLVSALFKFSIATINIPRLKGRSWATHFTCSPLHFQDHKILFPYPEGLFTFVDFHHSCQDGLILSFMSPLFDWEITSFHVSKLLQFAFTDFIDNSVGPLM